ncbi:hypothetical protein PQR34_46760, partial [Paraburkholderia sediminicola]|uniref:hypothetical protein n=1 Tax=Paraburkholderia sediminicola TaxID=458836 RepID=UPI0038B9400E
VFALFAVSDGWGRNMGFLYRLMEVLYVPTFPCDYAIGDSWCRIDLTVFGTQGYFGIPTKYLVLVGLGTFGYGFLLWRGVVRLPERILKAKGSNDARPN